jgi:hypothetical protein
MTELRFPDGWRGWFASENPDVAQRGPTQFRPEEHAPIAVVTGKWLAERAEDLFWTIDGLEVRAHHWQLSPAVATFLRHAAVFFAVDPPWTDDSSVVQQCTRGIPVQICNNAPSDTLELVITDRIRS